MRQRILVIEDDPSAQRLVKRIVEENDYSTITTTHGRIGLAKAQKRPPDLIILDLALPDINGFKVLQELRADERTRRIPVLCITGLHDPAELLQTASLELKAKMFIRKPFTPERLMRQVRKALDPLKCAKHNIKKSKIKHAMRGHGARTIFMADDDPEFSDFLKTLLESRDYTVLSSATGKRTVERIAESLPDMAILDLDLPHQDGLSICRRLKEDAATRAIPAMILTGNADNQSWFESLRHGADVFYPKPIKMQDDFLQCVEALLHRIPYKTGNRGKISAGSFTIDPASHALILNGRRIMEITTKPFDLAYLLVQNRPHPMTRRAIQRSLRIPTVRDSEIDYLVHQLRKQIGPLGKELFKTVREQGYCFDETAALRPERNVHQLGKISS